MLQEAARQAAFVDAGDAQDKAAKADARAAFRLERRANQAFVKADLDAREAHVRSVHAASQARRHELEAADLRVELTLAEKDKARRALAKSVAAMRVNKDIDAFEDSLARTAGGGGDAAGGGSGPEEKIKAYMAQKSRLQREADVHLARHAHALPACILCGCVHHLLRGRQRCGPHAAQVIPRYNLRCGG
jgi:hypothetical protein